MDLPLLWERFEFDFKEIRKVSCFLPGCGRWSLMEGAGLYVLTFFFQGKMVATAWCGFQRKTYSVFFYNCFFVTGALNSLSDDGGKKKKHSCFFLKKTKHQKKIWGKIKKLQLPVLWTDEALPYAKEWGLEKEARYFWQQIFCVLFIRHNFWIDSE